MRGWFGSAIQGSRLSRLPPVVKWLGNVGDLVGFLSQPKQQIVVLGTIKFRTRSADLIKQFFANDQQVSDVVMRQQQLGRIVRFQMGVAKVAGINTRRPIAENDLVGIENIGLRADNLGSNLGSFTPCGQ